MSFQSPSGPSAKRRRIEAANATLRKPFRSPLISRQQLNTSDSEGAKISPSISRNSSGPASAGARVVTTTASSSFSFTAAPGTPVPARARNFALSKRSIGGGHRAITAEHSTAVQDDHGGGAHDDGGGGGGGGGGGRDNDGHAGDPERPAPCLLLEQIRTSQREMQLRLREARARLDLVRQARQIEQRQRQRQRQQAAGAPGAAQDAQRVGGGNGPGPGGKQGQEKWREEGAVDDAELRELTDRWKAASRLAAEELFVVVKERVEGMGGVKAWRESRRWQRGFYGGGIESEIGDEERNARGPGDEREDEEEKENEGEKEEEEEESEESEFTMHMMLQSLNIDPEVLGYDPMEDKWTD